MGTLKCYRTNKKNSGKLIRWKICFSDDGIKRNFTHFSFSFFLYTEISGVYVCSPVKENLVSSSILIERRNVCVTLITKGNWFSGRVSDWNSSFDNFLCFAEQMGQADLPISVQRKVTIQRNSCFNLFSLAKCNNIGKSGKSLSDSLLLIRPRYKDISTQSNISCDSKLLKVCTYLNP